MAEGGVVDEEEAEAGVCGILSPCSRWALIRNLLLLQVVQVIDPIVRLEVTVMTETIGRPTEEMVDTGGEEVGEEGGEMREMAMEAEVGGIEEEEAADEEDTKNSKNQIQVRS